MIVTPRGNPKGRVNRQAKVGSIQKERTNPQGNPKIRAEKQSRVKKQEGNPQIQNTLVKTRFTHKGPVKTQQRQSEKLQA